MMLVLPFLALGLLLIDSRRAADVSETAALAGLLVAGADAVGGHPAAGAAEAAGLAVVLAASWVVRGYRNPDPRSNLLAPEPRAVDASRRRIPDGDRAAFGVLWAAGFGYQLFGCETSNDMGDLQFLFVCCLIVALAGTAWSLYRSSPRATLWSLAACLSGFGASALDYGPVPDVARHEFVLYGTLAIVTAAFYTRWLPPGKPRPGGAAGSPHPAG